jgi:hypothetical protein
VDGFVEQRMMVMPLEMEFDVVFFFFTDGKRFTQVVEVALSMFYSTT